MICNTPFIYLEHFKDFYAPCCPAWVDESMKIPVEGHTIKEAWTSQKFQDFRASIIDQSFKYCNGRCPELRKASLGRRNEFQSTTSLTPPLKVLRFSFDEGCNLQCPTCRNHKKESDSEFTRNKILEIEQEVGKELTRIELSGTGDPIYSKELRNWMVNYDPEKYPNVKTIHLCTNAQLFTESFYSKLTKIKPYLNSISISIDASCKETYERVRLGGNWGRLVKNLKFINTISEIEFKEFNFVVQKENYRELLSFRDFLTEIFGNSVSRIIYQEYLDWNTGDSEKYQISEDSQEWLEVQKQLRLLLRDPKVHTTIRYDERLLKIPKTSLV